MRKEIWECLIYAGKIQRRDLGSWLTVLLDIYIMVMSNEHCIAPKGKFVAILSTCVETATPEKELALGLKLIGKVDDVFYDVSEMYEPKSDGKEDQVYISTNYDETSHFESTAADCYSLYERITGQKMDLTPAKQPEQ